MREGGTPGRFGTLGILRRAAPNLLLEGGGPVAGFYAGFRLRGVVAGVLLATFLSLVVYLVARRSGRRGVLVQVSLAFSLVQAAATVLSGNPRVYFIQPIVTDMAKSIGFAASVALGRPLTGLVAQDMFDFPPAVAASSTFRVVFGRICLAWAVYFALRGVVRIAALLFLTNLDLTAAVFVVSSTPVGLGLLVWSTWYAVRRFRASPEWPAVQAGGAASDPDPALG